MPEVYLMSYATPNFTAKQQELIASARAQGIANMVSYAQADLRRTAFYRQHRRVLDQPRGGGYWLWKPYFILETFKKMREGDVLINCDAGTYFLASPQPLVDICLTNDTGVVIFENFPLQNRQYCKRDVFVNLGCDAEPYWNAVHCVAGVNLFRKGPYATRFVEAWLEACLNPYSLTDLPNRCGLPDLEGFLTHRHDQAVLSVLVAKFSLETYRYPTKWGNFVKMPAYRVPGEEVVYPYHLKDIGGQYSPTPKLNSPYGTIFQVNREIPRGSSRQTKLKKVTSIVNTQKASLKNRLIGRFFKYMYKVENRIFSDRALPSGRLHAKAKYARLSFSQCGEDLLIDHIFKLRGIRHPSYLDIGAFHPWRLSNTAYFYLNGSRGVNVEPNPNLILAFHNERPLDVNLNVGIGDAEGVLDFYEISDRTLSTFSKKEADACAANGVGIAAVHQVQVTTLANVLARAGLDQFPDFLSLDVEGLEEEILRGLGAQQQYPKVICVETAEYSPTGSGAKRTDLIAFIESKGYYLYADTNLNSIFVKNEFWFV